MTASGGCSRCGRFRSSRTTSECANGSACTPTLRTSARRSGNFGTPTRRSGATTAVVSHDLGHRWSTSSGFGGDGGSTLGIARQQARIIAEAPALVDQGRTGSSLATSPRRSASSAAPLSEWSVCLRAVAGCARWTAPPHAGGIDLARAHRGHAGKLRALGWKRRTSRFEVGPLLDVIADRAALEEVVSNLVDNAIKYLDPARAGSRIDATRPTTRSRSRVR